MTRVGISYMSGDRYISFYEVSKNKVLVGSKRNGWKRINF